VIQRQELEAYIHQYLNVPLFKDYAPNGLQVQGSETIKTIRTAVTASKEVIAAAARDKAEALLVHHGYFWKGESPQITGMKHGRIKLLLRHDINLLGYHLPLDCHTEIGNNACLAKALELHEVRSHDAAGTPNLLWSGKLKASLSPNVFEETLTSVFGQNPMAILASEAEKPIEHVAFCTGGAQDFIAEAANLGADAYISGEVSERTYYQAKELNLHYFACGHHATERAGIQALGLHLAKVFDLNHAFIDTDNPV